jgi:hypothetical protein
MFVGLPDLDPLVRCTDPNIVPMDPDPKKLVLTTSKNDTKNLDSYCFVAFARLFILEK